MDIFKEIFNLPIIAQGALGSLLFWLAYQGISKSVGALLLVGRSFSLKWRKEVLLYEKLTILRDLVDIKNPLKNTSYLLSIYISINKVIQASIYFVLAQIAKPFIGDFANLAYIFTLFYLFLASKAAYIEVISDNKDETKRIRLIELESELSRLEKVEGKDSKSGK